jgi:spore germination cell wall hydrolase CwlJ-like protein
MASLAAGAGSDFQLCAAPLPAPGAFTSSSAAGSTRMMRFSQYVIASRRLLFWSALALFATAGATVAAIDAAGVAAVPEVPAPQMQIVLRPPPMRPAARFNPRPIAARAAIAEAMAGMSQEHRCLSEVLYFEARGETEAGQVGVAEVIFHRLASGRHGNTICAVIYEGATQTFCQFTFACDGSLDRPRTADAWRAAQVLAARIMTGQVRAPEILDGATHYHTTAVRPTWAPQMQLLARIGNHIFYRAAPRRAGVASLRGSQL